jgi:hypothetical protein
LLRGESRQRLAVVVIDHFAQRTHVSRYGRAVPMTLARVLDTIRNDSRRIKRSSQTAGHECDTRRTRDSPPRPPSRASSTAPRLGGRSFRTRHPATEPIRFRPGQDRSCIDRRSRRTPAKTTQRYTNYEHRLQYR